MILNMTTSIGIIGSGFSSLSSACYLAKAGYNVSIYEKLDTIGGRARKFEKDGFTFDMGPSWYWMPEVFENFFKDFGLNIKDQYQLHLLDPGYQIIYENGETLNIYADINETARAFENLEKGAGKRLFKFLKEAEVKYNKGMTDFVFKPSLSLTEFLSPKYLGDLFKLELFTSFSKHVRKYFKHPHLIQAIEFPVLFLGALPKDTPALYSLMNFADLKKGTWYPMGGMHEIIAAMKRTAVSLGVKINTSSAVDSFIIESGIITEAVVNKKKIKHDLWLSGGDYHHTESLLPKEYQSYTSDYWNKRKMAPSSIIYYLGVNKRLPNLKHHNLFFDADFGVHGEHLYTNKQFTKNPLFYVCAPSLTDTSVAPDGHENLFILIPSPYGLMENDEIVEEYFDLVIDRVEKQINTKFKNNIITKETFTPKRFVADYNSFQGNAYGLSNTLDQTAFLKPKLKSKKVKNLFFTGQLTTPGPGVPPSIISGKVVAELIKKNKPTKHGQVI